MNFLTKGVLGSLVYLLCGSACSSSGSPGVAGGGDASAETPAGEETWIAPFGGSRTCYATETACARNYSECMNGCWDSAFFDPTYPCSNVCKDAWPCLGSTGGTSCAVHAYDFSGGERLSALAEACNATLDHLIACGISGQIACETAAVVESPDMIERYECFSRSRCGAEERCNVQPDASLAEEICDAVASSCRESRCTVDAKKHLTADLPWFRSDTVEAAKRCLSERSCRDMHDCLDAWKFTAYAGAPFFFFFE